VPQSAIEEFAPAIGHVVISWAFLDQAIFLWVAALGGGDKRIIRGSFGKRIAFIREHLGGVISGEVLANGLDLLRFAEDAADYRHAIVHGTLTHYDEVEGIMVFVRPEKRFAQNGFSLLDLRGASEQMREAAGRLQLILRAVHDRRL
jgi:hypothetical protein